MQSNKAINMIESTLKGFNNSFNSSAFGRWAAANPGKYLAGAAVAGGAVGSATGYAIAPKGHKKWGVLGGPTGALMARGIYN
jgi:hypothetical protein